MGKVKKKLEKITWKISLKNNEKYSYKNFMFLSDEVYKPPL